MTPILLVAGAVVVAVAIVAAGVAVARRRAGERLAEARRQADRLLEDPPAGLLRRGMLDHGALPRAAPDDDTRIRPRGRRRDETLHSECVRSDTTQCDVRREA